jgi:antitoxin component YwqK of YwqJK toxin-antitoxin module
MSWFPPTALRHLSWGLAIALGGSVGSILAEPATSAAPAELTEAGEPAPLEKTPHATSKPAANADDKVETIRERYKNRSVKIERQVIQDDKGNFVNHGTFAMWSEQGRLVGRGEYTKGKRSGLWTRNYNAGEAPMLANSHGKSFKPPFVSTATFVDGKLHGNWMITDALGHEVLCWAYENGERSGTSLWYFPDGNTWREADYRHGELEGDLVELASDGSVVSEETYVGGRRIGVQVETFSPGVKKTEAHFLFAKELIETHENWWNGVSESKVLGKEGRDLRHGPWTAWFSNGQKSLEGRYENDQPAGTFVWWHPNGQKAIVGEYADGKQSGKWHWWYPSGQLYIQGRYLAGHQTGNWTWWTETGKVNEVAAYTDEGAPVSSARKLETVSTPPKLEKPSPESAETVSEESEHKAPVRTARKARNDSSRKLVR